MRMPFSCEIVTQLAAVVRIQKLFLNWDDFGSTSKLLFICGQGGDGTLIFDILSGCVF